MNKNVISRLQIRPSLWERLKFWIDKKWTSLMYRAYEKCIQREEINNSKKMLKSDLENGSFNRTIEDHYSEENDRKVWLRYKNDYDTSSPKSSEIYYRASKILGSINEILLKDKEVKSVFNFGSTYGWLENEIAEFNPDCKVFGFDRRKVTKDLNDSVFKKENLEFVFDMDIHDYVNKNQDKLKDSIFIHSNIGVYFLPKFLDKLYALLFEYGVKYIVIWEPSGISRVTNNYYQYSTKEQNPEIFRSVMVLNNYPNLLFKNNFECIKGKIERPPHGHSDFRSLHLISKAIR